VAAAWESANQGIAAWVLSMPTIKPLDTKAVMTSSQETRGIVTIEEHSIIGGLGSAVVETLATSGQGVPLLRLGLADSFSKEIGDQDYLRHLNGLSIDDICHAVRHFYNSQAKPHSSGRKKHEN
jgi:transketolase